MASKRDLSPAEIKLSQFIQEATTDAEIADWDAEFALSYPTLWVFLTWRQVGDVLRAPGRLSLTADGTAWRLGYYDPSAKRSTAVVGATVADCLSRMNLALTAPETVWSGGQPKFRGFQKRKKP